MPTPRSAQFDDIYFSPDDGLAETRHVFLQSNNLPQAWVAHDVFHIAELGFGTGLNFLAAASLFLETAQPHQHLVFSSVEKYPLSADMIRTALAGWAPQFHGLHEALCAQLPLALPGEHPVFIHPQITRILHYGDITQTLPAIGAPVDCWFLDGFAPAKNPDMWQGWVFQSMRDKSATGARLATFTAAGAVKRGLREAGFAVEKIRGFGRKRDMLAGTLEQPGLTRRAPAQNIGIVGGGIAGSAAAYFLHKLGLKATLFESAQTLAAGASGNQRGLFNPRFGRRFDHTAHIYASGYALAHATYSRLAGTAFQGVGNLHLITDDDRAGKYAALADIWGWPQAHAQLLDAADTIAAAGIALALPARTHTALYLPDGGSINPATTCQALAANASLKLKTAPALSPNGTGWQLDGDIFDAVILANGADITAYAPAHALNIQTVRGQISLMQASDLSAQLRCNLQYGGYLSTAVNGSHALGATFQPWLTDTAIRNEDHVYVRDQLAMYAPALAAGLKIKGGRAALRVTTRQRTPLVGELAPRIYASTAHGSHGLVTGLWAGWQLARHLRFGFPCDKLPNKPLP